MFELESRMVSILGDVLGSLRQAKRGLEADNSTLCRTSLEQATSILSQLSQALAENFGENDSEATEVIGGFAALSSELSSNPSEERLYELIMGVESVASHLTDVMSEARLAREEQTSRHQLINALISHFSYERYLEIGCRDDACFSRIDVPHKVGMDPVSGGTLRMTSDEYFATHNDEFDIVFVDGLHEAVQVHRDIENALKVLRANGTIVMHDCRPLYEVSQLVPQACGVWNGDVWKACIDYRQRPDLDIVVGDFDHGCGVIRVRENGSPISLAKPYTELSWEDLDTNRDRWLRLSTLEQILSWV